MNVVILYESYLQMLKLPSTMSKSLSHDNYAEYGH